MLVALVLGALFAGLPVLWMLSSSFKSNREIFAYPPRLITKNFSFDAYTSIFTDPTKLRFFVNSYFVAVSVTVLTLARRGPRGLRVQPVRVPRASGRSTSSSSACRPCRRSRC